MAVPLGVCGFRLETLIPKPVRLLVPIGLYHASPLGLIHYSGLISGQSLNCVVFARRSLFCFSFLPLVNRNAPSAIPTPQSSILQP